MRKSTLTILILLLTVMSWSQVATTVPTYIPTDYADAINIIFDATKGTAGLKDYLTKNAAGTVYAHIGVITNASTSDTDWKHAPSKWGDNSAKYKCTSLGNNKWQLTISNMKDYFGLGSTEVVRKLAIVFRSGEYYPTTGTAYLEGKDTGSKDIFITVGYAVEFITPATDGTSTNGAKQTLKISTTLSSALNIKVNGTSIATRTDSTSLITSYTFPATGDYQFIASATTNTTTVYDTVNVCVPNAVTTGAVEPSNAQLGINYIDNNTVTLVLDAPNKTNVLLIGSMNNWIPQNAYQLKKDPSTGYWWIKLTGLTAGKLYGFQYLVDGTIKASDPYTELALDPWNDQWINYNGTIYPNLPAYPTGKTTGLVATLQTAKTAYSWEVTNFATPSRENMVIYELLLRDFTSEKSLAAAITKLDYLKNLGITAIELMPVQEFEGNNSWGYNPSLYFAPDKAYGNSDMYKKFVDECHKRGIAVILDIVLNHSTGLHPFAMLFWDSANSRPASNNPWMNVTAPHPYSVLNDFNHSYSGTREYFKRMVKYWINEYKVDGYRLDLTKGLTQTSSTESTASAYDQSRIDILTDYYNAAKEAKSDVMFILEHFCDYSEEAALAAKGMYLWRNSNNAYSQAATGFQSSSDFSGMITSPRQWVGYAESHDEERNFFKAKTYGDGIIKTDSIVRIGRVPLNIAFSTLLPGPKMMWEFGEMGFDYSIDSNGGRTNPKPAAWGLLNLTHRKAAADACAKIISLRKMYPTAFTQGTYSTQVGYSDWSAGRRIALAHNDLNMVALGNFQSSTAILGNPGFSKTGLWYNLLTGQSMYVANTSMTISMQPGELLIYTDRQINFTNAVENPVVANVHVFPTITNSTVYITSETEQVKSVKLYSLQGHEVNFERNNNEVNISGLRNGLYLLEVNTDAGKAVFKIVKE